ncbi:MAG: F0F1 ATP synthase subunit alpha, partial [Parachlamydiaceae bacterium]|nr:F0F1 ATP synthase subunit alpha [Parachlamydiaceae bacterium]
ISNAQVHIFEKEFIEFVRKEFPEIPHSIVTTKDLDQKNMDLLMQAGAKFKEEFNLRHKK